ncbi:MAG: hypothetical protein Unbinned4162contig1001_15 [Prokaryotic dsDNA virus sp.]|nr:MAG: hypothetical protein Unbinned4162contig1001_15 [Prokaryotic dsDNA virus sp.]|tara:strand:+ start:18051 stop:18491 length:441 start_codon:yes stop_codon:yes gene_type:complete
MNVITQLMATMSDKLTTVKVKFKDACGQPIGKNYTYCTDLDLNEGDEVVVDAPSTGMTVVVVTQVDKLPQLDPNARFNYKWIVSKVDVEAHDKRQEKYNEIAEQFQEIQAKAQKAKMINQLKVDLGYGAEDECPELDSLLKKIADI